MDSLSSLGRKGRDGRVFSYYTPPILRDIRFFLAEGKGKKGSGSIVSGKDNCGKRVIEVTVGILVDGRDNEKKHPCAVPYIELWSLLHPLLVSFLRKKEKRLRSYHVDPRACCSLPAQGGEGGGSFGNTISFISSAGKNLLSRHAGCERGQRHASREKEILKDSPILKEGAYFSDPELYVSEPRKRGPPRLWLSTEGKKPSAKHRIKFYFLYECLQSREARLMA